MTATENTLIKPQLRSFDLTIVVVSLVIGMGIFRTPVEVATKAGLPEIFFLAWIIGAVVSLAGALTFAEIGSRHPAAGGFYRIFSVCYTPVFAFMVNWITVISNAVSTAAVAIMGAEYMAPLLFPNLSADIGIKIISISRGCGKFKRSTVKPSIGRRSPHNRADTSKVGKHSCVARISR